MTSDQSREQKKSGSRKDLAAQLRGQSERLAEMNTALRVLLEQRDEACAKVKVSIRCNIKKLIEPYLAQMDKSGLSAHQQQLVDLIRINLEEIAGAAPSELGLTFLNLSPNELRIVHLIRKGKSSKEIALIMGISLRTVESYRNLIRRKLGLRKRKINLRTYLMEL